MKAAGGVKSTLEDMVIFYKAWMKELVLQFDSTADSTPMSPLRNLRTVSSQHARLPGPSFREQGYGLGWVRAQIPGQLGRISANPLIGNQPTAGKGGALKTGLLPPWSHAGIHIGCLPCARAPAGRCDPAKLHARNRHCRLHLADASGSVARRSRAERLCRALSTVLRQGDRAGRPGAQRAGRQARPGNQSMTPERVLRPVLEQSWKLLRRRQAERGRRWSAPGPANHDGKRSPRAGLCFGALQL